MNAIDKALDEATTWLMQARAAPADQALRAKIEAWIEASPDHARAWDQVRRAWRILGEVEAGCPTVSAAPSRRARVPTRLAVAAMALAACLLLVFSSPIALHFRADHMTRIGEIRRVVLEDGSVVHLAPHSALQIHFTKERRAVALLDGQAFFEVAHDPARPFAVSAEGLTATVLGTAFDVHIGTRTMTLGVRSGMVAVDYGPTPTLRLKAGERMTIDRATGTALQEQVSPDAIAGWRDGALFFADATVREVVEDLQRYQGGWIVIADEALGAERVTGLYDPSDIERALQALVRPAG